MYLKYIEHFLHPYQQLQLTYQKPIQFIGAPFCFHYQEIDLIPMRYRNFKKIGAYAFIIILVSSKELI